jgi:hypothetical protein
MMIIIKLSKLFSSNTIALHKKYDYYYNVEYAFLQAWIRARVGGATVVLALNDIINPVSEE